MFIGRRADGTIYGAWTSRQPDDADHPGIEEVAEDHPDVVAFQNRPLSQPRNLVDQILDLPPQQLARLKAELAKS